ncbi:MAG: DUF3108 domain-containing protein [Gemmatimonadota bacterium]
MARRHRGWAITAVSVLAISGVGIGASAATQSAVVTRDPGPTIDPIPFGPGEKAQYQVKLGALPVGRGTMEVLGIVDVSGQPTFHTRLHVKGGIPLARVDSRMDSWIDVRGLFSRRFEQDQNDLGTKRHRILDFYPESRTFRQRLTGEVGGLPTDRPLDDVSFLYYTRTLPLRPGDSYTINRYFKDDGNPVILNVLRRETITVPAGTFETVVVQPIIKTDGLFGEGGEAEVYFTDDDRRILVYVRSKIPIVGSMSLSLEEYEAAVPRAAEKH